jgi:tRNA-Thr(GGU) m(6)t(6)A37 methyltransferase TsaA
MNPDSITYQPIGIIHSPFNQPKGTPIQPPAARDIAGTVEIFPEYVPGLKDLDGFSHIVLLFHFHLSKEAKLEVIPFMDTKLRGVFATRAPSRPNPIGLSVVRLQKIENNILHILDVDIVDGTPLLDIKPYVSAFDERDVEKIGWLKNNIHKMPNIKDDNRFT